MNERIFLTPGQAIEILPKSNDIHTFYNHAVCLVGADWNKEDVIAKIKSCDYREITGEQAKEIGHGLALYNKTTKHQEDILFVETDMEKLDEMENKLLEEKANE